MRNSKGFSLIEIMIVISIIGILSGIGLGVTGAIQKNTRDAQRESDIRVLQSALQQYYADNNKYPSNLSSELTNGGALTNCSGKASPCTVSKTYLSKTPKDPSGTSYFYRPVLNISSGTVCDISSITPCHFYFLCSKMENPQAGSTCYDINYNFQATPL